MKSYRQFVTESFETSDGYKLDPRTKGEILSVGFAIVPPKTLIKGYGTNYCYIKGGQTTTTYKEENY